MHHVIVISTEVMTFLKCDYNLGPIYKMGPQGYVMMQVAP